MKSILASVVLFSGILSSAADDWPQWRGPKRDGVSMETGLLPRWNDVPKLAWENKEVGEGYGSPAVAEGVIYLMGSKGVEDEFLGAYSERDGRKLWTARIGKVGNPNQQPKYPGARSTPTMNGKMVYVMGSDGDVAAIDLNGAIKWQKSARKDFAGEPGVWAYSESPLVDGEVVVFAPGGGTTLVALNKTSGETVWKTTVPDAGPAAYSSTIVMELKNSRQYVQLLGKALMGFDAKTGKLLWRYDRLAQGSPANIPTPVVMGDYVYASGARTGAALLRIDPTGAEVTKEEIYFNPQLPAAIGGVVLVGKYIYGCLQNKLMCVDLQTGNVKWETPVTTPSALMFADGNLYLHGENGSIAMVEATENAYRERGHFIPENLPTRPQGAKAWAYPVVANGKLLIRDWTTLWSFDLRKTDVR